MEQSMSAQETKRCTQLPRTGSLNGHSQPTASPTRWTDGTVYLFETSGAMHALSPDGIEKWVKRVGTGVYQSFSSPSIGSDGTVYVGTDSGRVVAIKPNGNVKWYVNTGKAVHCTPAIAKDGTIIFGSYNGF